MALLPGLQWTAPTDVLVGHQIVEVDMRSAGLTVIRAEKLVPPDLLARLEAMPKGAGSVAIGKLNRVPEYKGISDRITQGIRARMEALLRVNGVEADRILSVKRDAVFLLGAPPSRLALDDGTRFSIKNAYSAFAKLGTVEVYANLRRGTADLKGIPTEREVLHRDHTLRLVLDFLGMLAGGRTVEAADTLRQYREDYVSRRLPLGFYREFNAASSYAVRMGRSVYHILEGGDVRVEDVEIVHNLRAVVVPLARSIA